jgi:hypothetical protein
MTDSQHVEELREHLECSMFSVRQEMLLVFVKELMVALRKQNYMFDDLLDALSQYSEQRSDWLEATQLIDRAVNEIRDRRRELTGK